MKIFLRIIALGILALGITFLVWGINLTETFANRFMKEMGGQYPDETRWYIFWGVVMIAVSLGYLIFSFIRKRRL